MTQITQAELIQRVGEALAKQGFPAEAVSAITTEVVSAEVAGAPAHGVGKLISLNLGEMSVPATETTTGSLVTVDGQRSNGFLLMRRLAARAIGLAEKTGTAVVFARNFSRYGALYPYTEEIARAGFIGMLLNNAGPAAVAPYGATDPITGTNPICFSFPVSGGVHTIDFATAERTWGTIREAALAGEPLPDGAFLDAKGAPTTDPDAVNAVRAFGGPKGFALNLAIELLCGAATGSPAGLNTETEFDLGAVLLAFDPARTGASDFAAAAHDLVGQVRAARPATDGAAVRVPGDTPHGELLLASSPANTVLEIPQVILDRLTAMSQGDEANDLAANPLFN